MAVLSLLVLAGAGCSQPVEQTPPPADQNAVTLPPTEQPTTDTQPVAAQITLTGEALGKNMVKFSWELPAGMTDPASFRLVRGPNENPVSPGNYYFQLLGSKRDTTWISLPAGKQNFRICTFVDDKCDVYSNNIEVDVK